MIAVFDGKLIEGQEEVGMRVLGQFRDLDDTNRFTWMREFPNMEARGKTLTEFYTGPVWKAFQRYYPANVLAGSIKARQ